MSYMLAIMLFMGNIGYVPDLLPAVYQTEQDCRAAGALTGLQEMPAPNSAPSSLPPKGWLCIKA